MQIVIPIVFLALGLFALLIVVLVRRQKLFGQEGQERSVRPTENLQPERLQLVHRSGGWASSRREIYRDAQTGVQYLVVVSGYGTAVTPVLDRDGRPLVGRFE